MIEYTPEDYEFALRILHHREDLTEEEVSRWMDEPEHLELLREMAFVRMSQYEENREEIILGKRRLNRALHGTRRVWVMGSVAASILIIFGGVFETVFFLVCRVGCAFCFCLSVLFSTFVLVLYSSVHIA